MNSRICMCSRRNIYTGVVCISQIEEQLSILVPRSVTPMGNVTKYLQKLGMGIYDNENQPGVSKKITRIWGNRVLVYTNWK